MTIRAFNWFNHDKARVEFIAKVAGWVESIYLQLFMQKKGQKLSWHFCNLRLLSEYQVPFPSRVADKFWFHYSMNHVPVGSSLKVKYYTLSALATFSDTRTYDSNVELMQIRSRVR